MKKKSPIRHLIIPDTQVTPESDTRHLKWAAQYAVSQLPDTIIFMGDHFDFPSLSSYDIGKIQFEGRRYRDDLDAGIAALATFLDVLEIEVDRRKSRHLKRWHYRLIFLLGNHENRIVKTVEEDRKLEDFMSLKDLRLEEMGFEVFPFLEPVVIDGVCYAHFFTSGVMGRPVSSARVLINKKHMSCVMGHVQDRSIEYAQRGDGVRITGLFAGIFYQEDLDYLTPQTNQSWRGIWMLNDVVDGAFDEMPVSLKYLERKYGDES